MAKRVAASSKASEAKQKCPNSCKQNHAFNSSGSTADRILQLQRTAGNQAVQKLIKSRALQAKLKIGPPNDIYEQEADRVAEQVMRMPEPQVSYETEIPKKTAANSVQRKCQECKLKKNEEEKILQAKEISSSTPEVTPELESHISAFRGSGQPLPESTRAFFEQRFGYNFSGVRVHTDSKAAESARAVNAVAYTVGQAVVFGDGQYMPEIDAGRQVLAHELTHVVQQERGGLDSILTETIQRQQVIPVSNQNRREFILDTIHFFKDSANFYSGSQVPIDKALFERVINNWYLMIVDREKMIDDYLGSEASLRRELRSAYIAAIRVLMSRAARVFGKNEKELYHENNGRIPMWAWQTPHHMEKNISTPIAGGHAANVVTGKVTFFINGFQVTIAQNGINLSLGKWAQTKFDINWSNLNWKSRRGVVTAVHGPAAPSVRIQTFYGSGITESSISGYGRGTTPEDVAGGKFTPRSKSVGFHEGNHGLDFVEFLENNSPPHFNGSVGMTVAQIEAAENKWRNDCNAYVKRMNEFSVMRTHCVGTTIDQFNLARATPGARVVHICNP